MMPVRWPKDVRDVLRHRGFVQVGKLSTPLFMWRRGRIGVHWRPATHDMPERYVVTHGAWTCFVRRDESREAARLDAGITLAAEL